MNNIVATKMRREREERRGASMVVALLGRGERF
jgi:hypothetical protein